LPLALDPRRRRPPGASAAGDPMIRWPGRLAEYREKDAGRGDRREEHQADREKEAFRDARDPPRVATGARAATCPEALQAGLVEPALAIRAEAGVRQKGQAAAVAARRLRAVVALKVGLGSHPAGSFSSSVPRRRDRPARIHPEGCGATAWEPREPGRRGRSGRRRPLAEKALRCVPSGPGGGLLRLVLEHREGRPGRVLVGGLAAVDALLRAEGVDLGDLRLNLHQLALHGGDLRAKLALRHLAGADQLVGALAELLERGAVLALQQPTLALQA